MAFHTFQSLAPKTGIGSFATVVAAGAEWRQAISNLKSTAATLAQARDPFAAALAQCRPLDITGVTRVRAAARLSNLASMSFTDARVMFFGAIGQLEQITDSTSIVKNVRHIERLDAFGDSSWRTTAFAGSQGRALNIPASPSSSNMLAAGDYLFAPPVQFTDQNGVIRDYLDVASFNILLVLPVLAATGATVTGETSELGITSAN